MNKPGVYGMSRIRFFLSTAKVVMFGTNCVASADSEASKKKAHSSSDLKALIQPVFEFSYPKEHVESSFHSLISPNRFCDDMHVVA